MEVKIPNGIFLRCWVTKDEETGLKYIANYFKPAYSTILPVINNYQLLIINNWIPM